MIVEQAAALRRNSLIFWRQKIIRGEDKGEQWCVVQLGHCHANNGILHIQSPTTSTNSTSNSSNQTGGPCASMLTVLAEKIIIWTLVANTLIISRG